MWKKLLPGLCVFCLLAVSAQAVVLDVLLDRHLVKYSELIFQGEVSAIAYHNSTPAADGSLSFPHTFVTFKIEELFKGSSDQGDTVTLRFRGGLDETDGSILILGGAPLFDIGDKGIFFVRRNGQRVVPLVGWNQGFVRIEGSTVYSNVGYEMILSDDPLYAARIHPRDIINYDALVQLLISRTRDIDKTVWNSLAPLTQQLIEKTDGTPEQREYEKSEVGYIMPRTLLDQMKSDMPIRILRQKLIPSEFRVQNRNLLEMLLHRDLNFLLLNRTTLGSVGGGTVTDPNTGGTTTIDPNLDPGGGVILQQEQDTIGRVALANRRILEAAYPDILIPSLDESVVTGAYQPRDSIMSNLIGSGQEGTYMAPTEEGEGPLPTADPLPDGKTLDADSYIAHLKKMVEALHTPDELKALPVFLSDIENKKFSVEREKRVAIPFHLQVKAAEPANELEAAELKLFQDNGRNPVFKQQ